jgi:hypothetical protein
MTTKELISLERRLLPSFPGFAIRGRLVLIPPARHTLRGINFEPSGFNKERFYATAFYLPLCIPRKYLSFTFGKRLKSTGWRTDDPNSEAELIAMMQNEVQFLNSLRTPNDVLVATILRARDSKNPYHNEAIAYMLARTGETTAAIAALDRLLQPLDPAVAWQCEMGDRARGLKAKLLSDPIDAQRQLTAWENESVRNLGLEEFR